MPILNYTTDVDQHKTIGQIQNILGAKGARSITLEYDHTGDPTAVSFMIILDEAPLYIRLPRNVEGVLKALQTTKGVDSRYRNRAHATRVSWRILKDWLEAQMALVESNQAQMAEVFLPYAIDKDGVTAFQRFAENRRMALGMGAKS